MWKVVARSRAWGLVKCLCLHMTDPYSFGLSSCCCSCSSSVGLKATSVSFMIARSGVLPLNPCDYSFLITKSYLVFLTNLGFLDLEHHLVQQSSFNAAVLAYQYYSYHIYLSASENQ